MLPLDRVIGCLDDFATRSGFLITPVVVWAGRAQELVADPAEVHSVHRIPVRELLRADAPILEPVPDGGHPVLKMPVGRQWIAAPTAAILYQFREWCLAQLGPGARPPKLAEVERAVTARFGPRDPKGRWRGVAFRADEDSDDEAAGA